MPFFNAATAGDRARLLGNALELAALDIDMLKAVNEKKGEALEHGGTRHAGFGRSSR